MYHWHLLKTNLSEKSTVVLFTPTPFSTTVIREEGLRGVKPSLRIWQRSLCQRHMIHSWGLTRLVQCSTKGRMMSSIPLPCQTRISSSTSTAKSSQQELDESQNWNISTISVQCWLREERCGWWIVIPTKTFSETTFQRLEEASIHIIRRKWLPLQQVKTAPCVQNTFSDS